MGWIDSHCHLTYEPLLSQLDAVLARAAAADVTGLVTIATDLEDAARALQQCARYQQVHVAAGIHPHEAGKVADDWRRALREIAARPEVVAVGEMGLDYHYDFADRSSQRTVFAEQLGIAAEVGKPIIIHCREAHVDTLSILRDVQPETPVVFHCFTGTVAEADEILLAGYWISLTGVVTFKKSAELQEVARRLPPDRMMVETDSPYLSPEPLRHVRPNEPAHVVHTARRIAVLRDEPIDAFMERVTANTIRFFNLPATDGGQSMAPNTRSVD